MYGISRSRITNEIMVTHSAFSWGFSVWGMGQLDRRRQAQVARGVNQNPATLLRDSAGKI